MKIKIIDDNIDVSKPVSTFGAKSGITHVKLVFLTDNMGATFECGGERTNIRGELEYQVEGRWFDARSFDIVT